MLYAIRISRAQIETAIWLANDVNIDCTVVNFTKSVFFVYGRIENWGT